MTETLFKQVNYTVGILPNLSSSGRSGSPTFSGPSCGQTQRSETSSIPCTGVSQSVSFWQNAYNDDARGIGVGSSNKRLTH